VELEWQPGEGGAAPSRYEVRGGPEVLLATGTGVRVRGLAPDRKACFAVTALGEGGLRSPQSDPACATTPPDTTPPRPPDGLAAAGRAAEVQLTWRPSSDDVAVIGYEVSRGDAVVARSAEGRAVEAGLPPGQHCYLVRALDAAGNRSAPSAPACATLPDVSPPSAPAPVTASAGDADVSLAWEVPADDVGVVGYEVQRDGATVARPTRPGARESGLRGATRYCYRVVALDAAGNRSPPSAEACATTPDRTPPSAPADLTAAAAGAGVALRWSPSTDESGVAGYQVWRGGQRLAEAVAGTAFTDPGPMPSAESCYEVRAADPAGNLSSPSAQACLRTPDLTPPSAPADLAAAPASATEVVLAWRAATDNVGVSRYEVRRGERLVATVSGTRASEAGLAPRVEHCYTVRAYDEAGNASSPSARACATTPDPALPAAPTGLEARRLAADEVELRWPAAPSPGATYVVYWDGDRTGAGGAAGEPRVFGETPLTSLRVFGAPARQRHCFQLSVRAGGRESPRTLPLCVDAGSGG
jgi:chitodextrinase